MEIYKRMKSASHVLIAGQTGSGKSVLINGFISALYQSQEPFTCILIDPKGIELYPWAHTKECALYCDSEPVDGLEIAKEILTQNFQIMRQMGSKAYSGPPLYVIIDELSPLILQHKKRALPLLEYVGNLGRAANVHLIMGTQSPARRVIPASVQVNCDLCIALKCKSAIESRAIIGISGAENLEIGQCLISGGKRLIIPLCPEDVQKAILEEHRKPIMPDFSHLWDESYRI